MNLLVVSPHRDDAAFSLGLAIRGWLAEGHRVTVLGVFSRSLSAPFSDADTVHPNDLLSYVSAMRRREDTEFLKLMPGLKMVDLNLKDAVLRLRRRADEVYTLPPTADDPAIAKLQKALGKLDAEQAIDAFVLPLALGHHVDHLVVRDAATSFVGDRAAAFYEDLPDALLAPDSADTGVDVQVREELSNSSPETLLPFLLQAEDAANVKRKIVSVYASQIDEPAMDAISGISLQYGGGERIWANAAWIKLFATTASAQSV